jgi:hypothetical protein
MRLAAITNWAYGVTVALTLASGATMLMASSAQEQERAAVAQRDQLDAATAHIDEDVFALSEFTRQFVVGGDPSDLLAYQREAQILGKLEDRTRHMRDAGAGPEEVRLLHEALRWADALQDEQRAAINARRGGDRVRGIAIAFGAEYERELDRVRTRVEQFQSRIDQRTDSAHAATATSRIWRTASESMIGATGLIFLCVLYFVFRRRVLRPVVKLSDVVTAWRRRISMRAARLRAGRRDWRHGAGAAGLPRKRNRAPTPEKERDEDRWVRDVLSRMTQRMQSCDTIEDLERRRRALHARGRARAGRPPLSARSDARGAMVEACSWLSPALFARRIPATRLLGPAPRAAAHRLGKGACRRAVRSSRPRRHLRFRIRPACRLRVRAARWACSISSGARTLPGKISPEIYLKMVAENVSLALDNLGLRDALRHMAMADPLTGLPNRRQLENVLATHARHRHARPVRRSAVR